MTSSMPLITHSLIGQGDETLLFLNGGMMSQVAWMPVAQHLKHRYRLLLCDLRGQLLSPGRAPSDLAENVDDLVALLDHLDLASAHVVGTSYGGEVGLLLAALRPERVRSLVAVTVSDHVTDSILVGSSDLKRLLRDPLDDDAKGRLYDRLIEDVYSQTYKEDRADELATRRRHVGQLPDAWFHDLEGILEAISGLDLRELAPTISCPTLVVLAEDDRVIPPERSRALAASIPGATLAAHPTSGHALVAEDPDWLGRVALAFLEELA